MTKPIFPPHEVQRTGRDEKSNNPLTELNECSYPPYCISLFYLQIKPFYTDIFYLIAFGVISQGYGVNSKAYGDNSKGLRR